MGKVEYIAFPRVAAIAEVAWSPLVKKDYANFRKRLSGLLKHYDGGKLRHGIIPK
jgi:hexosaminidase